MSKIKSLLNKINKIETSLKNVSDEELSKNTEDFKERIKKGESLDSILPEAYATVSEAAYRVLGMRPYDVQKIGGIALHNGEIAEMKTGEGKAITVDTPVPTPNGWRKAGDIQVGDKIFARDGSLTTVLGVFPQHMELIKLREELYDLTQRSESSFENITDEEKKQFLQNSRIAIVGGHDNWTKKLKSEFPKWKFYRPEPTGTIAESSLSNTDYIYFFTDFISHSSYYRYMNYVREHNLSFGYLNTLNIEANINKIYTDLTSGKTV